MSDLLTAPLHWVDSHCHLDEAQFDADRDAVIQVARDAGVGTMINIAYQPAKWASTLALVERHPGIRYTLGLHPSHSDEYSPAVMADLRALVARTVPVAIGEIGIDFTRPEMPPAQQFASFDAQIAIALEFDLPIVIHQRAAEADLLRVLGAAPANLRIILHSFDGTDDLLQFALERGAYIGVGGLMTKPSAGDLRAVLQGAPLDRIVLETDAPYLVPADIRDRRNVPANIPAIGARLANLLGEPVERVAAVTTANVMSAFPMLARVSPRERT